MKDFTPRLFRRAVSSVCILLLGLVHFPLVALASNAGDLSRTFDSQLLPANSAMSLAAFSPLSPQVTFSNATSISVTDRASGTNSPNGTSSPYPSTIAVSGLSGTTSLVTVSLNGLTTARPRDIDVVVVAPGGQTLMLMSDTGDLTATSAINLTFADAAATAVPTDTGSVIPSGTYKPTDFGSPVTNNDVFPSPGPAAVTSPAPTGTATLATAFNGGSPNGNWSLYVIDDSLGGGNSTISGGWTLNITTAGGVAATTTAVTSSLNPSLTTQAVTFTASVTSGGSPVNAAGTVSFTRNGTAITGCTNVAVNGSGQSVCTAAAGVLPEGTLDITATYSGTGSFGTSSGSISQTVNSPTVVTGSQFCNNGGISLPDTGSAAQYPSSITVSGLVGTISKVTANVNGITSPRTQDIDLLLVAPGSQALAVISDVGDATAVSNINLTLDDAAPGALPIGSALASGTFRPTDNGVPGAPDSFPAPAPGTYNSPAPAGAATFATVFNGLDPNGTWRFFARDDSFGGGAGTISGVCVNFTLTKFNTSTTVSTSSYPIPVGQNVTFTAVVTTTGTGTPSGSVQFFDGATSIGTSALNGAGQATLTTSTLTAGNHLITARYLGATVGAGNGGYVNSNSAAINQFVGAPTAANVTVFGRVLSSSGAGVANARIAVSDAAGNVRYAITNPFGFYRLTEIAAGSQYLVSVTAKNKQFAPRLLIANDETGGFDFVEIK